MSIVRVFKHDLAFPNTWMVKVSEGNVDKTEMKGNVCAMYDEANKLLGYNLLDMETLAGQDGYQAMNEALLKRVNQALETVGFSPLIHDFKPRIVVGKVVAMEDHPDSDHLHVCQVDIGEGEPSIIVCGAHNVETAAYVVAALDQAVLPDGKYITSGKLRGVLSHGMLCSAWELGLIKEKQKGLLILDDTYAIGSPFDMERGKQYV